MATNDYFMRQVEGMADMLSALLFDRVSDRGRETIYETQLSADVQSLLIDLRLFLFRNRVNEAENLLFERMEAEPEQDYRIAAAQFYSWLDAYTDDTLQQCDYTREEIAEGRKGVEDFYAKNTVD